MDLAIEKARQTGVGWVVAKGCMLSICYLPGFIVLIGHMYKSAQAYCFHIVLFKGSTHFGIAGYYTMQAAERNLLVLFSSDNFGQFIQYSILV